MSGMHCLNNGVMIDLETMEYIGIATIIGKKYRRVVFNKAGSMITKCMDQINQFSSQPN